MDLVSSSTSLRRIVILSLHQTIFAALSHHQCQEADKVRLLFELQCNLCILKIRGVSRISFHFTVKPAEPFGDASKRHARLTLLQRTVEIICTGVTNGGVITGDMFVGQGGQRRNYSLELVGAGLATLDERKLEYGEVPKMLMDAMAAAQKNRVGIWSIEQKTDDVSPLLVSSL